MIALISPETFESLFPAKVMENPRLGELDDGISVFKDYIEGQNVSVAPLSSVRWRPCRRTGHP